MVTNDTINYLSRKEINTAKWDQCIDKADNGLIYAYSFYLDHIALQWDALVLNDYQTVMPLTWNKKYGIYYLFQPLLCAQLGVFGNNIDKNLVSSFLKSIPKKFRYWDISLNHGNGFLLNDFHLHERNNFILSLNKPYENLLSNYRENSKRNINKSRQLGCYLKKDFGAEKVIQLAIDQMKNYTLTKAGDFDKFYKLYLLLHKRQQALTYGIFSAQHELLASCIFFFSHSRAYYILVGNHPDGKSIGASHALIDSFIKEHSGTGLILDFEGSDIKNLAFFYSSFGAAEEKYPAIKLNRLSWLGRLFKK
jgi:hypothetical protein